ncbi:MAG: globin [Sphingobium sp.]
MSEAATHASSPASPYDLIGPERVAALVRSFYDLIEGDPAYARLRAIHDADLGPVRAAFERFLTGWLGGPRDWFGKGQCVMSLHRPMDIDRELGRQWADAMTAAIAAQGWDDERLARQLGEALSRMAGAMVSRN